MGGQGCRTGRSSTGPSVEASRRLGWSVERGSRQVETCNLESLRPHTKIPCPFLVANLSQNPVVSEPGRLRTRAKPAVWKGATRVVPRVLLHHRVAVGVLSG